jgi:hypothetical protein
MPSHRRNLLGAAGQAGGLDVSEVFSIDTWTGTGATQTITNGIDLAGEGGIVIIKEDAKTNWHIFDTVSGVNKYWHFNTNDDLLSDANTVTSFNSDGFTLGSDPDVNQSGQTFHAYTFRQAPNFFEITAISHTNGADSTHTFSTLTTASMIMCKRIGSAAGSNNGQVLSSEFASDALSVNLTALDTASDANEFERNGTDGVRILSGMTTADYIAYCWDTALDIVSIGTYTGDGTSNKSVSVGFQPQYVMTKSYTNSSEEWYQFEDVNLSVPTGSGDDMLRWNRDNQISSGNDLIDFDSDGFNVTGIVTTNNNSTDYLYMAIKAE